MLHQSNLQAVYPIALVALLKMVNDQSLASTLSSRDAAIDADEIFLQDWEDQSVGASSFSVLKSSTTPFTRVDLTAFLGGKDIRQFLGQGLKDLHQRHPQQVRILVLIHFKWRHADITFPCPTTDGGHTEPGSSGCLDALSAVHDLNE